MWAACVQGVLTTVEKGMGMGIGQGTRFGTMPVWAAVWGAARAAVLAMGLAACASGPAIAPTAVSATGLSSTGLSAAELRQIDAGTYLVGPDDATLAFSAKPLGIGQVSGFFEDFDAVLTISDSVQGAATLGATVRVGSLSLANYGEMVRGPGWFDAVQFPEAAFSGTLSGWDILGAGQISGQMQIRDITQDEIFNIRLTCAGVTACPGEAIGIAGDLAISRSEYGMTALPGFVSDTVQLSISGTIRVVQEGAQ